MISRAMPSTEMLQRFSRARRGRPLSWVAVGDAAMTIRCAQLLTHRGESPAAQPEVSAAEIKAIAAERSECAGPSFPDNWPFTYAPSMRSTSGSANP